MTSYSHNDSNSNSWIEYYYTYTHNGPASCPARQLHMCVRVIRLLHLLLLGVHVKHKVLLTLTMMTIMDACAGGWKEKNHDRLHNNATLLLQLTLCTGFGDYGIRRSGTIYLVLHSRRTLHNNNDGDE